MKVKIKCFNGDLPEYLTLNKEYQVITFDEKGFDFLDDANDWVYTLVEKSSILNGGSWEIVK